MLHQKEENKDEVLQRHVIMMSSRPIYNIYAKVHKFLI